MPMLHQAFQPRYNHKLAEVKEHYTNKISPKISPNTIPVLSLEGCSGGKLKGKKRKARFLKEIFGQCKIILVLRNPIVLVESLYFQFLRLHNVGNEARFGKPVFYQNFSDWFQCRETTIQAPFLSFLEYYDTIQIYSEVFGEDSLKILLHEELVHDSDYFISSLCDFIGIATPEAQRLCRGARVNERLTANQMHFIKYLNNTPTASRLFQYSSVGLRERFFTLAERFGPRATRGEKARVELDTELLNPFIEKKRAQNREIATSWGLPLEKYGYPM